MNELLGAIIAQKRLPDKLLEPKPGWRAHLAKLPAVNRPKPRPLGRKTLRVRAPASVVEA